MSAKDKSKNPSTSFERNIDEDRDINVKKNNKKSEDKDKSKFDGNKSIAKEERFSTKTTTKSISDKKTDIITEKKSQQMNTKNNANEDSEERRLRRKEREDTDKGRVKPKEDVDKDSRTKTRSDLDDYNSRHRKDKVENSIKFKDDKEEFKNKRVRTKEKESKINNNMDEDKLNTQSRIDVEESNSKHRQHKEKDSASKHKTETNETNILDDSKRRHRSSKEDDSRTQHRVDNEESGNRHKSDKDVSKLRRRDSKDENSNRHKSGKDESKSKHRDGKDESKSGNRMDRNVDNSQRKSSSQKDRFATDEKGDKNVSTNGKSSFDRKDRLSEVRIKSQPEVVEYEEDFEDYNDEDFEDTESTSSAQSEDAVVVEDSPHSTSSKEVSKPPSYRSKNDEMADVQKNKCGIHSSFINFRLAQKKCSSDAVANRMLSRAYDLSRLIDLDRSHFDILDVAPIVEHSKYMMMFGRSGCQHLASQTGDDNMGRESQTDVIDERTVWCQHPPLDDEGCVRVISDTSRNNITLMAHDTNKSALEMLNESGVSSASLIQVLELMDRVLEEEASPEVTTKIASTTTGQQVMSLGYNKYSCEGLPCIMAGFSSGNSAIFATVHDKSSEDGDVRNNVSTTFVCIWRVSSNYREPQRYLSCPVHTLSTSCITYVTFSPDSCPAHLFGGLDSGIIALWDLRDHPTSITNGDPPAYFTGVSSDTSGHTHQSPIVALHTSSTKTTASSYQLLSLDSSGTLSIWIVSSLQLTGSWTVASGSLSDLNLRPGHRSRMSIIATVSLLPGPSLAVSSVTCMAVDPSNPSQIFIGNQNGHILHHDRAIHNKPLKQGTTHSLGRMYGSNDSFESGSITHLDFYPFFEPYFLAGYTDGSLKIFTTGRSEPVISLWSKNRAAILVCKWSKSHPAILFSLDGEGNFTIWNVLISLYSPVHGKRLPGYVGFDVSSDSRWHSSSDRSVYNKAHLLLWALNGSIEVHELHPVFVTPQLDDCFKTCALLESLL